MLPGAKLPCQTFFSTAPKYWVRGLSKCRASTEILQLQTRLRTLSLTLVVFDLQLEIFGSKLKVFGVKMEFFLEIRQLINQTLFIRQQIILFDSIFSNQCTLTPMSKGSSRESSFLVIRFCTNARRLSPRGTASSQSLLIFLQAVT